MQISKVLNLLHIILFHCFVIPLSAHGTLLLCHGSFAQHSSWYRPGGAFFETLSASAKSHNVSIDPFQWSGKFLAPDIINDAGKLATHLLSLPPTEDIIIVAHSNGGNVTAYATMLIAALYQTILDMEEQQEESAQQKRSPQFPLNLYEPFYQKTTNGTQKIEPTLAYSITQLYTKLCAQYAGKSSNTPRRSQFLIKALYMLGTPINTDRFAPAMNVIEHVYNLYSEADFIQSLAGKRLLPHHERRANLHVGLETETLDCDLCLEEVAQVGLPIAPCHECLHDPLVAQWILDVPSLVSFYNEHTKKSILKDGMIWLSSSNTPTYQPTPEAQVVAADIVHQKNNP